MERTSTTSRHRSRRWLLGASALPLTALLGACTGGDAGSCVAGEAVTDQRGDPMGDASPLPEVRLSERGLALSPDGTRIAANQAPDRKQLGLSPTSGTVLWDTAEGTILERFDNGLTGAVAWHPEGEMLAVGGSASIALTDPAGTLLWQLTGHEGAVIDLAFHPDGQQLASLGAEGTVRLWSTQIGACSPERVLKAARVDALSIAYAPDGGTLAVSGPGRAPELWDPASGRRRSVLRELPGTAYGAAYAADGTLLIGTDDPVSLRLLDPDGELREGPAPLSRRPLHIAPGPEDRVAVGGQHDNQVMLWDRRSDEREDLPRVRGSVGVLRFSPDGAVLYGVSQAGGVLTWDGESWQPFELP